MHKILVMNPKGGCGKSTISSQLAAYYANWGMVVGLSDMDPQKSSLDWLRKRSNNVANIIAINAVNGHINIPGDLDYLIIDSPAGYQQNSPSYLSNVCDTILIPVLPSAIDTQAASHFIYQLLIKYRITYDDKNICVIANRAKLRSVVYRDLLRFLKTINLPLVATLRESKYYLDYAANGGSIFDATKTNIDNLLEDWQPIIQWLHQVEKNIQRNPVSVEL